MPLTAVDPLHLNVPCDLHRVGGSPGIHDNQHRRLLKTNQGSYVRYFAPLHWSSQHTGASPRSPSPSLVPPPPGMQLPTCALYDQRVTWRTCSRAPAVVNTRVTTCFRLHAD